MDLDNSDFPFIWELKRTGIPAPLGGPSFFDAIFMETKMNGIGNLFSCCP